MKTFASIAFALVLGALSIPASSVIAPVNMTAAQACGTGGNASRSPHCNTTYLQSCAALGYRGPCGLGGVRAGNGYGNRYGYTGGTVYGHRPVIRRGYPDARPYYRAGYPTVAGGVPRARRVAVAPPPPSPEQVAAMVKHRTERVPVDCAGGYSRVEGSNRCQSITWVPGED